MTKVYNGCILPLQQILQPSQDEELKTGSIGVEVEKQNEVSNFESKEHEAPTNQEIQAEEESETQKDSEVMIPKHSFVEKVGNQMHSFPPSSKDHNISRLKCYSSRCGNNIPFSQLYLGAKESFMS